MPAALQAEMKAALRALFDLPDDAKRQNKGVIAGSSYVAPSPANPLYDAFGLYDTAAPANIDAFCTRLSALPHARDTAERMHELIVDIAGKVASSLGLQNHSFQDWSCQFRMNRYNYTQETMGSSGVQIHTDSGFLTLLQEDNCVVGLEVLDPAAGEFVLVDHVPSLFLVNIDDVSTTPVSFQAWSNGRLHAVKYRVQCMSAVQRISIAMFLIAPKDDRVSAPEAFLDAEHPRRFKLFNYDDYRKLRLSTGEGASKALSRMAA